MPFTSVYRRDVHEDLRNTRHGRINRLRRQAGSELAKALFCLCACVSALLATSPPGEEKLMAGVIAIRQTVEQSGAMALTSNSP